MFKKILVFLLSSLLFLTVLPPVSNIEISAYKAQSSGYWVGMVNSSTNVTFVDTVGSYADGIALMNKQESTEKSVASLFKGGTIIASRYATLDFTTTGSSAVNSYMYAEFSNGTYDSSADYFNGYYTAEGPYITTGSTETKAVTVISGLRSRVNRTRKETTQYEIVPISVSKPLNYYVANSSGDLYHYFAYFSSQSSLRIGKAPEFMTPDVKYYSYDGHYFYTSYLDLIDDLNTKTTTKAINPDLPWYNYYQFLPFHSTTNYTASDIDNYIRLKGYNTFAYTFYDKSYNGQSKYPLSNESLLYSSGSYFMQMQQIYGVNPIMLLSISANESAWGRSYISIVKNNLFGMAAYDSSTSSARAYDSVLDSVLDVARVLTGSYFNAASDTNYYHGNFLGNKEGGVNVKYASDAYWGEKAASYYYSIDKTLGLKDYNTYVIGITNKESTKAYKTASTDNLAYYYNGTGRKLKNNTVLIIGEEGDFYKVMSDYSLAKSNNWTNSGFTTEYDFENNYVYVLKTDLTVINQKEYVTPKNNEEINKIRIEYLNEFITLQTKNDATIYYDAYLQTKSDITIKNEVYLVANERSYTSSEDYSYKIIYNDKGSVGWISAKDVKEMTGSYAIKYNKTHDAIGSTVYESTSTSSKNLGAIKYNNQFIYVIESKKVDGATWYYTCLNPATNTFGWTLASGYNAPIKHTAVTVDPNPDKPEHPDIAEKHYVEAGMYYLDAIKLNEEKNAITIRGLLSIGNMDNTFDTDISYKLVLKNQQDGTILEIPMDRWTNTSEHPFDATSIPGYKNNFSGAWFTQTFNFKDIPNGDYSLSIEAHSPTAYTAKILSNDNSIAIDQRFVNENNSGIELRTNFLLRTLPLELFVRHNGLIASAAKPSLDNAFIEYTKINLNEASLNIRGTAFNINGSYAEAEEVKREIIFENTLTFERYTFDANSIIDGDGQVVLRIDDGKDKTRAWFDTTVDLSTLSKGTYAIYIHTISGNGIDDYGELSDSFIRPLEAQSTSNGIMYSIKLNKDKRYRLELVIE
ncbi:MAG: glucosaminidase domain-containing protein [Bacilli bacterium]|nr:glucosaminidase domain-containing protein [Bacilli bacterium]